MLTLDERERLAYAANDREALAVLRAAEAGAEEIAADLAEELNLDAEAVKGAKETETALGAALKRESALAAEVSRLRSLAATVEFLVYPYTGIRYGHQTGGAIKPAPKWAQTAIRALRDLERTFP